MRTFRDMFCAVLLLTGTVLLLPSGSGASDWRLVRQSSYGDASYYDAASLKRLEGQKVSLRARLGAKEYGYEMACGKKEARLTGEDAGGDAGWFPLVSGTDEELIYQAVCP